MSRDRDDSRLPPEPLAGHDDAELGRAESFAELIDEMLTGHATPPALTPENRDLLEVATMIRAANHDAELAGDRRDLLINRAFAAALDLEVDQTTSPPPLAEVVPLRRKVLRAAPWVTATVAAAAAVLLAITRPAGPATRTVVVERVELSAMHRSRPADPLIGRIAPADSGQASERLDIIFDDRMTGYRDLKLRGLTAKRGGRR